MFNNLNRHIFLPLCQTTWSFFLTGHCSTHNKPLEEVLKVVRHSYTHEMKVFMWQQQVARTPVFVRWMMKHIGKPDRVCVANLDVTNYSLEFNDKTHLFKSHLELNTLIHYKSYLLPGIFSKQRGSFLSRDKSTLARIAEFTKDRKDVVGGAKQGGNFVFQHLSPEEVQGEKLEERVEVSRKKRHSLPITKKAKVQIPSRGIDDNSSSSIIFKYL